MEKIKNIIFDLGGVFLPIDYQKTEQAFLDLGVHSFADLFAPHFAVPLFEQLETGQLSPHEFYDAFRQLVSLPLTNQQIEDAWNAMLGMFSNDRLNWLQEIGSRYNIYLYSNTNIIHYQAFQKAFQLFTGKPSFDDYFIRAWYSHSVGVRKPYPESFTYLLQLENLSPHETLFIDDTFVNVQGAQQAGLHTIYLQRPKTVFDLNL